MQKLSCDFKDELDISFSVKICLRHHPAGMESSSSAWSEDDQGRFVLEKKSWNTFADKYGLRNGSVIQFCFARKRDRSIDMNFWQLVWYYLLLELYVCVCETFRHLLSYQLLCHLFLLLELCNIALKSCLFVIPIVVELFGYAL